MYIKQSNIGQLVYKDIGRKHISMAQAQNLRKLLMKDNNKLQKPQRKFEKKSNSLAEGEIHKTNQTNK